MFDIATLFLTAYVKKKWGIDIEARHREAINTGIINAASGLIANGSAKISEAKIDVGSAGLANAIMAVQTRVPDALNHFGVTPMGVRNRILEALPKIPDVPAAPVSVDGIALKPLNA